MTAAPEASGTGARTIVVNGTGGNTLSFQLPPGVTLDVESVFAAVDATAAGATTATLTIAEQSGVVIANKAQSQTVTAGVIGSATWALRLTDESASVATATALETLNDLAGTIVPATSLVAIPWVHNSGASLLDLSAPTAPVVKAAGVYAISTGVGATPVPGPWVNGINAEGVLLHGLGVLPAGFGAVAPWEGFDAFAPPIAVSLTATFAGGETLTYFAANNQAASGTFRLGAFVQKLG